MSELTTIYMALIGEGVDVWRSVQAEPIGPDLYFVLGPIPEEEEWAFPPGSLVRCVKRELSGDYGRVETHMVAISCVKKDDVAH